MLLVLIERPVEAELREMRSQAELGNERKGSLSEWGKSSREFESENLPLSLMPLPQPIADPHQGDHQNDDADVAVGGETFVVGFLG